MTVPKAMMEHILSLSGYVGSTVKMNKSAMSELRVQQWEKATKAMAVNTGSIALNQQDVEIAVKPLNAPSIFTPFVCYIKIVGDIKFHFWFSGTTRFGELFFALQWGGI